MECDGTIAHSDQVRHISTNWRNGRIVNRREMRFLNRPFEPELAPHMRRFLIIDPGGVPTAILDFDPIFRNGDVIGYTAAFKRKLTGTTPHAEIGLTKFATDRFREEGRSHVTFGLSPLAAIAAIGFSESRVWRSFFERATVPNASTRKFSTFRARRPSSVDFTARNLPPISRSSVAVP